MNKIIKCAYCQEDLTINNCYPSFLEREFKVCSACDQNNKNERYARYRLDILKRLGNKCRCCKIENIDLLSIDHIHGGGNQEKLMIGSYTKYIRRLNKLSDHELNLKYQALCYNCNYTRGFWGSCPIDWKEYDPSYIPIYKEFEFKGNDNEFNCATCKVFITKINCGIFNNPRSLKKFFCKNCEIKRLERHGTIEEYKKNIMNRRMLKIKARLEMVKAYGGKCVKCSIEHPLFLTLDHMNNNGKFDETGIGFYKQLKKLGFPGKNTQLQLLCHNCNAYKEYKSNRKDNDEQVKIEKENYIKQDYLISKEEDNLLKTKAFEILSQITKHIK